MKNVIFLFLVLIGLQSCIGDDIIQDFVGARVRITSRVDTLGQGDTYQFEARFSNNIGQIEEQRVNWSSSDLNVLNIDAGTGLAEGISMGIAQVFAQVTLDDGSQVSDTTTVVVAGETSDPTMSSNTRSGKIRTTSSYALEGDFTITQQGSDLQISFGDNYKASSALPGLYIYITNNPNTTNNALEIGKVTVFEGAHNYAVAGVDLDTYEYLLYYCKPFNVKVGDGKIE